MQKLVAGVIAVPAGMVVTGIVLWLFDINPSPVERWLSFPSGWRIYDLVTNAAAALMLLGAIKASYHVILEVWSGRQTDKTSVSDAPNNNG